MDASGFWAALWAVWGEEAAEFLAIFRGSAHGPREFVLVLPFVLSCLWTVSALHLVFRRRGVRPSDANGPVPSFSVLIPFHAEADAAIRSARILSDLAPPPEEILLVDDGTPQGQEIDVAALPPRTRLIRLPVRRGKAGALNAGLAEMRSEVVACLDADTEAVTRDWEPMLERFRDPRLAAVTGKVWPASAGNPLELLQSLDYLAVICLIKAAETLWGGLTTVSGAWVAFRREALLARGGWNEGTAAEDIDMSWWLQAHGWKTAYAPEWTATVEMAPTWRALWRQRRRWSAGLGRAVRDHFARSLGNCGTNLPVVWLTACTGLWLALTLVFGVWASAMALAIVQGGGELSAGLGYGGWWRYVLLSQGIFLIQLAVAIAIDRRPDWRYPALVVLSPFYALYFWLLLFPSAMVGLPLGLARRDQGLWRRTARHGEVSGDLP